VLEAKKFRTEFDIVESIYVFQIRAITE